jgi:YbbR domain-containing protein
MRLLRNFQLKILAIIFAMVLWFHVATNQRYDLEILYNISYVNIPDKLALVEQPVSEFAVMLRGSGKGLMRLMWGDRNWPIDLSRAKVGSQKVAMHAEQVPFFGISDLEVLGLLDGDTVTVTLDSLAEKVVPIRSSVQIEPTEGFIVADAPILTPDSTVIIGPKHNLDQIHDVWTKPEFIVKVDGPVERLLPVLPPPVFGVTTGVQQIRLYHKIEPYLTRAFESVPVRVEGQLSSDEFEISPDRVFVEVAGPQSAVVQLVVDSIAVICHPLFLEDTAIFVRAAVTVPAPLRVLKLSPDSVTVERSERTRADTGN